MRKNHLFCILLSILVVILLPACSIFAEDGSNRPPIDQQPGLPTSEIRPVVTATHPVDQMVTIYVVAVEDKGISGKKIGCDDSLVAIQIESKSILNFPWNAVETLLRLEPADLQESGFYSAFNQSDLTLVKYETQDGLAKVYLEGDLMIGGVCDHPRIEEQLYATILQDNQIEKAEIFINGEKLEEYLSLQ